MFTLALIIGGTTAAGLGALYLGYKSETNSKGKEKEKRTPDTYERPISLERDFWSTYL